MGHPAVEERLSQAVGPLLFDDLWAEWMQFACVQDEDLQDWLKKQALMDSVVVSNRPTRAHKLTRGKGIGVQRLGIRDQ